ncbi:MAG TPA: DUF4139 domain-containing protein [Micromonosporaceae bacterium]
MSEDGGKLAAPIVAVTVYPDRARVTRRGRLRLGSGEHRVAIEDLPMTLRPDSVRVAGTGPATVLGVDVVRQRRPRVSDETIQALQQRLRAARAILAAVGDDDAIASDRLAFLTQLAQRAARTYAAGLAAGQTDLGEVARLADGLADQQAEVRREQRALAVAREQAVEEATAIERSLSDRFQQRDPDRLSVVVALAVSAEADLDLELSYVVDGAGWSSAYDLRLADAGTSLTLTWFGQVTQRTGEDWPECDLRLSTARPGTDMAVPRLDPWFLDRVQPLPTPPPPPMARKMAMAADSTDEMAAVSMGFQPLAAPMTESVATVELGVTAATYRPAHAVAVPADGAAHRTTVAVLELDAERDYVTAPVLAPEVHLRATVTNTSEHTLPAGPAAVFHGGEFVGATPVKVWAPGEELTLALGVDDRIRVERELVRRSAAKAALGANRRREAEHRIKVVNHTPGPARVTVLDQLPVSRDEAIVVKEQRLEPAPTERTELGVLTWVLDLEPDQTKEVYLGVRVDQSRGVELAGWRE